MNRSGGDWDRWLAHRLGSIRDQGRWRAHREFDAWGPRGTLQTVGADSATVARPVLSFASNDYLGLSIHPAVIAAAHAAINRWGTGAGASRLVTGDRPVHEDLECELAAWKGTDRAVLFPTGFTANLGVLTTLGTAGTAIISDELNHASLIDGSRLAKADVHIAPHDDPAALDELLAKTADQPTMVVIDAVFSMDGDAADLAAVAASCRRHRALLVIDEAHAVLGPDPAPGCFDGVEVVRVGTLSKTLGALGGFAACSDMVADLLVNAARSAIFTTGLSPADAGAALAAVQVLRSAEGAELQATLRRHVDRLRPGHPSPIVPLIIGSEDDAVAAAGALLERGLLVPAIRPPTVAPGTSRLRITFSAAHTDDDVALLLDALAQIGALP
ncbi:MAG: 7-keto-8-aminopelargonate synthetase-like enzyme [Ilumatobacteraceae bacterium]|nr:7-keto-8-aminopelargonate synthetase-like enzyme [Ilumatobacteraceae bacterium]